MDEVCLLVREVFGAAGIVVFEPAGWVVVVLDQPPHRAQHARTGMRVTPNVATLQALIKEIRRGSKKLPCGMSEWRY